MKIKLIIVRPRAKGRLLLNIMRVFIFLLCTTVFGLTTENSFAQEKIIINKDQLITVDDVFDIIQTQTKYHFLYPQDLFKNAPKVQLRKGDILLSKLLEYSLSNSDVRFKLSKDNAIVINKKTTTNRKNQQQFISGIILDESGLPLVGTNIIVKSTNKGVQSDFDGRFNIDANPGDILIVSFVGYITQKVTATSSTMTINLVEETNKLDEVVITGYTEKEKRKLISAISTVSADKFENIPVGNLTNMLQGQAPGLLVQAGSGEPGAGANIVLRGVKDLGTQPISTPLFLLDGVEITGFDDINPNDIESVSVLKDAAATAIYGSRGAKGVIVITSKRGKKGEAIIQYRTQSGFSIQPRLRDYKVKPLSSSQIIDLQHTLGIGPTLALSQVEIDSLKQINTNWLEETTRTGRVQTHEVTVSGGGDKTDFFVSASLYDQEGIILNSGLKRISSRINLNHNTKNFKIGANVYLARAESVGTFNFGRASNANPFYAVYGALPYDRVFDPVTGEYARPLQDSNVTNTLEYIETHPRENRTDRVTATVNFQYNLPIHGLSFRSRWGLSYRNSKQEQTTDPNGFNPGSRQGRYLENYDRNERYTGTNSLHYDFKISDAHVFNAALYQEFIFRFSNNTQLTTYGLTDIDGINGSTNGTEDNGFIPGFRGGSNESALSSYFATLDYYYANKYNLSLGVRRDGSSNFGVNNKFGYFYSIGAGYVISEEDFMSSMKFVNFAKLRASFGTTGNDSGDDVFAIFRPTSGYAGQAGIESRIFNPDLKWETTEKFDIGLDANLFNNFLSLGIDFYNEKTSDFFVDVPLSLTTGFDEQERNTGSLQNRGVEISIQTNNIRNKNFTWTTAFNIAHNKSKVLSLPGGIAIEKSPFLYEEGQEAGLFYLVRDAGVNPVNGNSLFYTSDGALTEVYDAANDRISIPGKRRDPKYFGGFTNTFKYRDIQLSVLMTYATGHFIRNESRRSLDNPAFAGIRNVTQNALNYWREPGDITDIPRADYGSYNRTDRFLEDASYLKFRNIRLAYNLPNTVINKLNMSSLQLYLQGQNLYTFTSFSGTDPENSNYNSTSNYPQIRTFTLGLDVKF